MRITRVTDGVARVIGVSQNSAVKMEIVDDKYKNYLPSKTLKNGEIVEICDFDSRRIIFGILFNIRIQDEEADVALLGNEDWVREGYLVFRTKEPTLDHLLSKLKDELYVEKYEDEKGVSYTHKTHQPFEGITVINVTGGVARIGGLLRSYSTDLKSLSELKERLLTRGELIKFYDLNLHLIAFGLAINILNDQADVLIFGNESLVQAGCLVSRTKRTAFSYMCSMEDEKP